MADRNLLAGTAFLSINGVSRRLVAALKWDAGVVTRETLAGMDGIHGVKAKPKPGKIEGQFRDAGDLRVADFNAITDATVVFELANGKTVVGRNMWTVDSQEVESEDGVFNVKFEGPQGCVRELTA